MAHPNAPPPLFSSGRSNRHSPSAHSSSRSQQRGNPATLNLDDIFGDVVFTPDGDTVFLSEADKDDELLNSGEGDNVATMASKPTADGKFRPVQQGGGLYTTNLADDTKASLAMGTAAPGVQATKPVPFQHKPQASHHLQYAAPKKKKSSSGERSSDRKMSDQQKDERRYVAAGTTATKKSF
jgi:hypothetical protein